MLDRDLIENLDQDADGLTVVSDKVFVRDLVLDIDIGVFANEHGVTQRVRFAVEMDVTSDPGRRREDDVVNVISYDTIVEGIKDLTRGRHINLVETLATEIAELALRDPRAFRVRVQVEKLDKEPGSVGVEIVRERAPSRSASHIP